ncbi:NAD(P)-dependent oxidoreductase [Brachybacterium sp. EF45031]|uniref:NAD(P)-dependent oxidoreductase n=1 Tax=Brachybacterium sillae TaxID=2810536 RepID=UPI00217CF293|nr:NAD(P)-dependent oxidoreductase [Brachybacterium sillae]MCS6712018.1 NAD(P)-dependent oxidoreductase [Brachybacterium sillae]
MKIAFLGTGRMGTELARHLLTDHDLTVWNRTAERTRPLVDEGATRAETPREAVADADVIITSLFGPDTVREVVLEPSLVPDGVPWVDATTVSPADADEFARAVPTYVAAPVVGTLGPARNGTLGVYVGTPDDELRQTVMQLVAPWADPDRLRGVTSGSEAATGKLLANLALAVSAQGLREALALGTALGVEPDEILTMLKSTGLDFIAGMKGPFVRGERDTAEGDFTVDALAKDARLMLAAVPDEDRLPAVRAALISFEEQQEQDRGDHDFSVAIVRGPRGA